MILNGFWCVFFGGMLGPVVLELLKIIAWRDAKKIKHKYGDWRYWLATAALFLLAGIVTVINGVEHVTLLQAVQLGIGAPAIVAAYATSSDAKRKGRAGTGEDVRGTGAQGVVPRLAELLAW